MGAVVKIGDEKIVRKLAEAGGGHRHVPGSIEDAPIIKIPGQANVFVEFDDMAAAG
jgi:hypothetical protein